MAKSEFSALASNSLKTGIWTIEIFEPNLLKIMFESESLIKDSHIFFDEKPI